MTAVMTAPQAGLVNAFLGLQPRWEMQISWAVPRRLVAEESKTRHGEPGVGGAALTSFIGLLLALITVPLWPLLFVAMVILLVAATPWIVGVTAVRAIVRHRRHATV